MNDESDVNNIKSIDVRIYFDPDKIDATTSHEKVRELIWAIRQFKFVEFVEVNHLSSIHSKIESLYDDLENYLAFISDAKELEDE